MTHTLDPHVQLLDDARQAAAVAARAQQQVLRDVGEQDATFLGSLEALAEVGSSVVVQTTVGRRLTGVVRRLAAEHVVLVGPHGTAWVRLGAVTTVRGSVGTSVRLGGADRAPRPRVALAEDLRVLVEANADVEVTLDGGERVHGTAIAAGRDVLHLREAVGGDLLLPLARAAVVMTDHS